MSDFNQAFAQLMASEGGYSNHPDDPGGETMWGITKRVAVENGYKGEMEKLPMSTAKEIAKRVYWDACQCDKLPYQIAFQVFDTYYNGGHAVKWLQQSLGVNTDGIIGPITIKAAQEADTDKVVMRFNSLRLSYYTQLGTWSSFGRGWVNRIAHNLWSATL